MNSSVVRFQIADSTPTAILTEDFPSLEVDWETGMRFVEGLEDGASGNGESFWLHPNEELIPPNASDFIKGLWESVRDYSAPMPKAEGWWN